MFTIFKAFASAESACSRAKTSVLHTQPLLRMEALRVLIYVIRRRYDAEIFDGKWIIRWPGGKQYVLGSK